MTRAHRTRSMLVALLFAAVACTGSDGKDGIDGVDGTDGVNGTDGLDGTDGTDGTNGTNGTNGTDGVDGTDGQDLISTRTLKNLDLEIVELSNDGGAPSVTFTVFDNDLPVTNLTMLPIRIYLNQYEPPAMAYDSAIWSKYNFYERATTVGADSRFVQSSPGVYTYTFLETIAESTAADGLDPALVQQVSLRISGFETYNRVNDTYQVTGLPTVDGGVAVEVAAPVGNIVETSACETCHGPRIGNVGHGGGYNKVEFCRNCHTADDPARVTNGTVLAVMIHQIHSAVDHTVGGTLPGFDWTEITYPQSPSNCNKCHQGADGQNWNTLPTAQACGSCHYDVNFATGLNHIGGVQATNANCAGCHGSPAIIGYHAADMPSPNNPALITGAAIFEYQINSVTVNAATNVATVNFAILKDGVAISDLNTVYPPVGFTGGPAFKLAYALPQDGIAAPADWNNLGTNQGQPLSATITAALLAPGTAAGTFDATLTAVPFPAGATMRAVGMDGYFTQVSPALARHTTAVVMGVTGDDERRAIINFSGCLDCHERLELHGGSRTIAADTDPASVAICTMCHNPNLSSSGNIIDTTAAGWTTNASTLATRAMFGDDPFAWPEATQNFKGLVHGIHSASVRESPFEHVRVRSGNAYGYDWSEVKFPGDPSNCSKCHVGDSYAIDSIPAEALMSTDVTGTPVTRAEALAVRLSVPNADDTVTSPVVAACYACHNSGMVSGHMDGAGALLGASRTEMLNAGPAQCAICHDSGSTVDVELMHPGLNP